MNDDGCQVEQHAGDLVGMWLKLVSSIHQAIEYDTGIRKCNILQNNGLCASRVGGARSSQIRDSNIVIAAIGITVLVLASQTRKRRVRKSSPEIVDESTSQRI
jgi:hypothetical protein